jgi:hypothetical protein
MSTAFDDAAVYFPKKRKDKKMRRIQDRRILQRSYRQPIQNPRLLKLAKKRDIRRKDIRITRSRRVDSLKSVEMSFRLFVQEDVDLSEVHEQEQQDSHWSNHWSDWSDDEDWLWWPRFTETDYYDEIWSDIHYHDWFWSELLPSMDR